MRTYLVTFDTRKTEAVEWVKPLHNYLVSVYGTSENYDADVKAFDKLRQDFRGVSAEESGIKLAFKYYSQLELLDLRIPFLSINRLKKIKFKWYDSFDPSVFNEQESIAFEKASVLFNCGMLVARLAAQLYEQSLKSGSDTEERAKKSIRSYQEAAGIFEYLTENFVHAPSADLSKSTCQFLIKLMLAQSHEVFMYRLINNDLDQSKNSLISKLCASAASHYEECNKMLQRLQSDEVPIDEYRIIDDDEELELEQPGDDTDSSQVTARVGQLCLDVVLYKLIYYKALTYYYAGLQLEKTKKYGNAIAYMDKSLAVLETMPSSVWKTLSKQDRYIVHELLEDFKFQKDSLAIRLEELNKDNDYIYHEIIPTQSSLPEIKPMDSSKLIPVSNNELFKQSNEDTYAHFLTNVVPMNIHELMSLYSEQKSELLRNNMDLVDVSNEELSSVLEYLNMPIAVVSLKQIYKESKEEQESQTIDPSLILYANEIAASVTKDEANKDQVFRVRKEIWDNITEIESMLARHVEPSFLKFKDEVIQLKRSLYNASNLDKKVFDNITTENQELLNTLRLGPKLKQFSELFLHTASSKKPALNPEISLLDLDDSMLNNELDSIDKEIKEIEDLLNDLNVLKSNKAALIDALKKEIHSDDISNILILNSRVKLESEIKLVIFPEELKKFTPFDEELDKLVSEQKRKVKDLTDAWNLLTTNSSVKDLQTLKLKGDQKSKEATERITEFYNNKWKPYSSGLKRSTDFYQQLSAFSVNVKNAVLDEESKLSALRQPQTTDYFNVDAFSQMNLGPNQGGYERQPSYGTGSERGNGYRTDSAPPLPPKRSSQMSTVGGGYGGSQDVGSPGYGYSSQYAPQQINLPYQAAQQHSDYRPVQESGYGGAQHSGPGTPQQTGYAQQATANGYGTAQQSAPSGYGSAQPSVPLGYQSNAPGGSYSRAPQAYPNISQERVMGGSYGGGSQQQQQQQQVPQQQQQQQQQQNQNNSGLIYNNPSTYQPNMYNFFSSNNRQ